MRSDDAQPVIKVWTSMILIPTVCCLPRLLKRRNINQSTCQISSPTDIPCPGIKNSSNHSAILDQTIHWLKCCPSLSLQQWPCHWCYRSGVMLAAMSNNKLRQHKSSSFFPHIRPSQRRIQLRCGMKKDLSKEQDVATKYIFIYHTGEEKPI